MCMQLGWEYNASVSISHPPWSCLMCQWQLGACLYEDAALTVMHMLRSAIEAVTS